MADSRNMSEGTSSVPSKDVELRERRAHTEFTKLELETEELRDRVQRGRTWYRGRFLLESIIGGTVAGALFVSWFLGAYSPRIELERERLEFRLESERFNWELERREKDKAIHDHLDYAQMVHGSNMALAGWVKGHRVRLEGLTEPLSKASDSETAQIRFTLEKEISAMAAIESSLTEVISKGERSVEALRNTIDQLDNDQFQVEIIYDTGFIDLARRMALALESEGFGVRLSWWSDFKEKGDGSMSRFFSESPALWFDRAHAETTAKSSIVRRALSKVLPPSTVVHEGSTVVVPGTVWLTPGQFHFQLWLFGSRAR